MMDTRTGSVDAGRATALSPAADDVAGLARMLTDVARNLPGGLADLGQVLGDLARQMPELAREVVAAIEQYLTPVERGQMASGSSAMVPAMRATATDTPAPATVDRVHVVRAGDTLSDIAAANGTSWQALARANALSNPDLLAVGQRIAIPASDGTAPAGALPATPNVAPSVPAAGSSGVSAAGLEALFGREAQAGVSDRLHWPGGASGVTLGPGYDLKGRTADSVVRDLTAIGIDRSTAEQVAEGAGLSGRAAQRFAADNRGLVSLSAAQETALLERTVEPYAAAVRAEVSVPLNQNQFDALVSFAYNIGINGFEGSTALRRLNAGDYSGAADAMRMWNKSDGQVVQGLVNRRDAEVRQFSTPGPAMAAPPVAAPAPAAIEASGAAGAEDFATLIATSGDARAQADLAAGRKVVVALRTDTNVANNPAGRYDDRIAVVWRDTNGALQVREFDGNTEPSGQYRFDGIKAGRSYGVDVNGDGRLELGRVAAGSYRYTQAPDRFLGNTYFRPDQVTPAQRDTNGDGRFDGNDANGRDASGAGRSMLIHQGGANNTWSAGCQTLAGHDFNAFVEALGGQRSFSYVLIDANR